MQADTHIDHQAYTPDYLRNVLEGVRTIAVVGASTDPWRPSFGVMSYLGRAGYRLIPVNPTALGQTLQGEPFRACLQEIDEPVDLINVFRRPEHIPDVVEDAIAIKAPALWLQLGVAHPQAAVRAEAAGLRVVMNRCISIEHSRLFR
ncbi:CoA-binding protein [Microvirga sp. GCM10011540]|uniref:CoA-binding protein n=1 Tax=Microvirga sp. GCM10011540 TaxID=3317338 RepID=UPI003606D2E3